MMGFYFIYFLLLFEAQAKLWVSQELTQASYTGVGSSPLNNLYVLIFVNFILHV